MVFTPPSALNVTGMRGRRRSLLRRLKGPRRGMCTNQNLLPTTHKCTTVEARQVLREEGEEYLSKDISETSVTDQSFRE